MVVKKMSKFYISVVSLRAGFNAADTHPYYQGLVQCTAPMAAEFASAHYLAGSKAGFLQDQAHSTMSLLRLLVPLRS